VAASGAGKELAPTRQVGHIAKFSVANATISLSSPLWLTLTTRVGTSETEAARAVDRAILRHRRPQDVSKHAGKWLNFDASSYCLDPEPAIASVIKVVLLLLLRGTERENFEQDPVVGICLAEQEKESEATINAKAHAVGSQTSQLRPKALMG
jgi:hypothetical protein